MNCLKTASKGFTLLEILVSISILAIVLVSFFKMQAGNMAVLEAEHFYSALPWSANKLLTDIETDLCTALDRSDGFEEGFNGFQFFCRITYKDNFFDVDDDNEKANGKFKKIKIDVSKGSDHSMQFHTWRYVTDVP
ncbi:MAG: prepilin-type N-terminal cleavage/methylation domain-containing protein [Desulfobacteraceae bacterium]